MTEIIDNKRKFMADKLSTEIASVSDVAIASAYFNVSGFSLLKNSLKDKPLKFLLGREPSENIAYQDEILSELEKDIMENEDEYPFFDDVKEARDYFSRDDVSVKIVADRFFHGKAYMGASPSFESIKDGKGNGFASTGSSNFTYGGLKSNRELNMLTTERDAVAKLFEWFEDVWKDSKDFKKEFIDFLDNYVTSHSPLEIVAKALYETLKGQIEYASTLSLRKDLLPHQKLSVSSAWNIMEKYGGAIVADPVGLGKTRVGIAL
ncbi:MAG: phospholipase D-like domain-containing protein, partial [Candidatus Parvarchaeota archaeon]